IQAHRKCQLIIYPSGTVGALSRRVTQVIGRELDKPDDMTSLPQDGERRVRHDSEPVHFTMTYGATATRHVFAEILYRHVDDKVYGV
ncbi:hypothetical protein AAVH_39604, partial [Aphelenchoides avenae]